MTEHEQLVEKVARSIYDTLEGPVANQDAMRQMRQWAQAQELSRAAIAAIYEAMREPSRATIKAGAAIVAGLNGSGCYALPGCQAASNKCGCEMDADEIWQAMLEASPLKGE